MEDGNRREENYEVTRDKKDDETGFDNQLIPRSSSRKSTRAEADYVSRQYDGRPTRSRSRSLSKNAFLNFMRDFRQDHNKVKSKDLFRLGGQRWRQMSSTEKMPYVKATNLVQQQSQQTNQNGQQNKPDGSDPTKKTENQDPKKKERERRKRSKSRTDDSEAESSDSATSGTVASMTSEDASDLSS